MGTPQRAIAEARKYLGLKEEPAGSNRQMFGEWYGMNGQAWCAMFLSYVADRIGVRFEEATTSKGFSYCPYIENWAQEKRRWYSRGNGRPGDWVLFEWDGGGVANHVELVVSVVDGQVRSVGGNTGSGESNNGGQVLEQSRSERSVRGYMRPPYAADGGVGPPATELVRVLRLSDPLLRGTDVEGVQRSLRELGYELSVDGYYGPETERNVRAFQKSRGLTADGIVGPLTARQLGL